MNISLFSNSIKNSTDYETITIEDFLINIGSGKWKEDAERIRDMVKQGRPEAKIREAKTKVPYVTASGVFSKRNNMSLVNYSGFIAIDIDHRESDLESIFNALKRDPYTFGLFRSISGRGLCVIIKGSSPDKHLAHWLWAEKYYLEKIDAAVDKGCKDISRARFVSYDPDCFINIQSKTARTITVPKKESSPKPQIPCTGTQVGRLCAEISQKGINLCESYSEWVTLGLSLADMGEEGRPLFHVVSAVSGKYNQKECDRKFDNLLATASGEVTISTFLYMCKNAGLHLHTHEEEKAISIAKNAKRMRSDVNSVVIAAKNNGISEQVAKDMAESVFSMDVDLNSSSSIITDMSTFIRMKYPIEMNALTLQEECNGNVIDKRKKNTIYLDVKTNVSEKATKTDVDAIIKSEMIPIYHPVDRWLQRCRSLPSKPDIIDEFLSILPLKVLQCRSLIYRWVLGLPALHYGQVVRYVLVLCGPKQIGKTNFFRDIMPMELQKYCVENSLNNEKEVPLVMSSNLIVVDDEFDKKKGQDTKKFKELTSKKTITFRRLYEAEMSSAKRTALLAGTSNEVQIINETDSNTRIFPVEYNEMYDEQRYLSINKDQLWIEIFRAYERGDSFYLNEAETNLLESLSGNHEVANYELEVVDKFTFVDKKAKLLTFTDIFLYLQGQTGDKRLDKRKVGIALRKRYDHVVSKVEGKTSRCYKYVGFEGITP